jgi:hypothetical protein
VKMEAVETLARRSRSIADEYDENRLSTAPESHCNSCCRWKCAAAVKLLVGRKTALKGGPAANGLLASALCRRLSSQLLLGVLFGLFGVLLAVPLLAVAIDCLDENARFGICARRDSAVARI